jgi:hypothetical protein
MLLTQLAGEDPSAAVAAFRECMKALHTREFEPFLMCARVCTQGKFCLYRHAVADLVRDQREARLVDWDDAYFGESGQEEDLQAVWDLAAGEARQLFDPKLEGGSIARRIGLCYTQHMLSHRIPEFHTKVIEGLIGASGLLAEGSNTDE